MTLFWILIAATVVVAAADWWAVMSDRRSVEYVLKPLTMMVLIAAAVALPADDAVSSTARTFFVGALFFSLLGDVFLMLNEKLFVAGLGSFLVAHLLYIIGLLQFGITGPLMIVGIIIVFAAAGFIGGPIVRGARETDEKLVGPVGVYIGVISFMVVVAIATRSPIAIVGALLFYASDGLLGWNRFVAPLPNGRLGVMTTYHLGQIGLVLALAV